MGGTVQFVLKPRYKPAPVFSTVKTASPHRMPTEVSKLLHVNYLLLLVALVPGFVAITALGIALAGISLVLKQNAWILPDAMAGALYLIAGTIFPIAILPGWLEKIALVMPLTYWLELIRRALLGEKIGTVFPIASTPAIVGLLALTTSLTLIACIAVFRISEHLARERGQIDRTTNY